MDLQNLLMEGSRRARRAQPSRRGVPRPATCPSRRWRTRRGQDSVTMTPEEWKVYFLVDGRREPERDLPPGRQSRRDVHPPDPPPPGEGEVRGHRGPAGGRDAGARGRAGWHLDAASSRTASRCRRPPPPASPSVPGGGAAAQGGSGRHQGDRLPQGRAVQANRKQVVSPRLVLVSGEGRRLSRSPGTAYTSAAIATTTSSSPTPRSRPSTRASTGAGRLRARGPQEPNGS